MNSNRLWNTMKGNTEKNIQCLSSSPSSSSSSSSSKSSSYFNLLNWHWFQLNPVDRIYLVILLSSGWHGQLYHTETQQIPSFNLRNNKRSWCSRGQHSSQWANQPYGLFRHSFIHSCNPWKWYAMHIIILVVVKSFHSQCTVGGF